VEEIDPFPTFSVLDGGRYSSSPPSRDSGNPHQGFHENFFDPLLSVRISGISPGTPPRRSPLFPAAPRAHLKPGPSLESSLLLSKTRSRPAPSLPSDGGFLQRLLRRRIFLRFVIADCAGFSLSWRKAGFLSSSFEAESSALVSFFPFTEGERFLSPGVSSPVSPPMNRFIESHFVPLLWVDLIASGQTFLGASPRRRPFFSIQG